MNVSNLLKLVNTYIGDTSTDRVSWDDRNQAVTEATAWLLEELGNEHMVDRTDIQYLPGIRWYKIDGVTPYLLTAGQLRPKNEEENKVDFTRVEARDLVTMNENRHAYAIERYNGSSYLGVVMPPSDEPEIKDLLKLDKNDSLTYTGVNANNIVKTDETIQFDTAAPGQTSTGLQTTSSAINLKNYQKEGFLVFELEIPVIDDITSVSLKFGDDLSSDYWLGTLTTDINGDALAEGLNILKVKFADMSKVGSPDVDSITEWEVLINHTSGQTPVEGYRLSDLRASNPFDLTFKYIFYRVGKDDQGVEITEFTAGDDIPFFYERYPQYRYAVAHKAAGTLFRSMQLPDNASSEDREAFLSLNRYRKNFSGERDMNDSAFKLAGVNLRGRRVIRRR